MKLFSLETRSSFLTVAEKLSAMPGSRCRLSVKQHEEEAKEEEEEEEEQLLVHHHHGSAAGGKLEAHQALLPTGRLIQKKAWSSRSNFGM